MKIYSCILKGSSVSKCHISENLYFRFCRFLYFQVSWSLSHFFQISQYLALLLLSESEEWSSQSISNLSNWKEEAWKYRGFNGIRTRDFRDTGAMLYQLSYEATRGERGQFSEFISPVRSEMMWSIYEIFHIWTGVVDESEEWSSLYHIRFSPAHYCLLSIVCTVFACEILNPVCSSR